MQKPWQCDKRIGCMLMSLMLNQYIQNDWSMRSYWLPPIEIRCVCTMTPDHVNAENIWSCYYKLAREPFRGSGKGLEVSALTKLNYLVRVLPGMRKHDFWSSPLSSCTSLKNVLLKFLFSKRIPFFSAPKGRRRMIINNAAAVAAMSTGKVVYDAYVRLMWEGYIFCGYFVAHCLLV